MNEQEGFSPEETDRPELEPLTQEQQKEQANAALTPEQVQAFDQKAQAFSKLDQPRQRDEVEAAHTAALADQSNIDVIDDRITGENPTIQAETVGGHNTIASRIATIENKIALAEVYGILNTADNLRAELKVFQNFQEGDREGSREVLMESIKDVMNIVTTQGKAVIYGVGKPAFSDLAAEVGAIVIKPQNLNNERLIFEIPAAKIRLQLDVAEHRLWIVKQ